MILESLVLKKFVISSRCRTGPKEILLNGKGGLLFKVGSHKQLASKIMYFFFNRKKCSRLLNKSYLSLNRFDYNSNLLKYYKLISSVR